MLLYRNRKRLHRRPAILTLVCQPGNPAAKETRLRRGAGGVLVVERLGASPRS